jgi:hypothetical protein
MDFVGGTIDVFGSLPDIMVVAMAGGIVGDSGGLCSLTTASRRDSRAARSASLSSSMPLTVREAPAIASSHTTGSKPNDILVSISRFSVYQQSWTADSSRNAFSSLRAI